MEYKIEKEEKLLDFLFRVFPHKSKNVVKNILKNQSVFINHQVVTQFNYPLKKNDIVEIKKIVQQLEIVYEDKNIVVVNKRIGISTIADSKNRENNLYHFVSQYLKKQNKNNKVFVIHRLDKETSGLVMFAKSKIVQDHYQLSWDKLVVLREYTAIVSGNIKKKEATLKDHLMENKEGYVYVHPNGRLAITSYEVLKKIKQYSMLKVHIATGRKNQIRVQLSHMGYPIIGDKKYHSKDNPIKRLGLHANKLEIIDPFTNQRHVFKANLPKEFEKLFKKKKKYDNIN